MKTKKKFFLKAAGISPVKGAGISLALVMMFAMAFAACDNGTSSSKSDTGPNVTGPSVMGAGPTAGTWAEVEAYLKSTDPADNVIYIRKAMYVPTGTPSNVNEVVVGSGKTLVIVGEVSTTNTSEAELPEGPNYLATPNTSAPRLYIQQHAKLTVEAGGRLVLGGPQSDVYGGIVNVQDGGALHVKEGSLLSLNMSSNVYVIGANSDGVGDYIALNIESGANVAIVGDFETGDTIITNESDNVHLIVVSGQYSPVALGAARLYAEIPTLPTNESLTENAERKAAYNNNRREVAKYSKIKVANTTQEVLEHINNAPLYPLVTLIYSGQSALVELPTTPGVLAIPNESYGYTNPKTPTTLVIQNDVQQNKTLIIKGAVEIAEGASIRVEMYQNTPAKLTLEDGAAKASLNIESGGTLRVGASGTLDLSNIPTSDSGAITMNGEIAVAAGGRINLPPVYTADQTIPQVSWGTGHVTLASGSLAFLNITGNGKTDSASLTYYIGPASATNGPEFSWTAGYTDSKVTLVGLDITLDGYLTVTENTAIVKKATVASGVLTVATDGNAGATPTLDALRIYGELEVASGAKVVVADDGILDLTPLAPPAKGKAAPVTLYGSIEVESGGTINLPAPQSDPGADQYKVTQVNYAGGLIKLNAGSKTTMIVQTGVDSDDGTTPTYGPVNYVGPATDVPLWQWTVAPSDPSYIELKANGEMALTGKLISANDNYIFTSATINSGSTLTMAAGKTLGLGPDAKLVVNGTIEVGGSDGRLELSEGLVAPNTANRETAALTLNGTINVASGGKVHILDPNCGQIAWGTGGEIKFNHGSLLAIKFGANNATGNGIPYLGDTTNWAFSWPTSPITGTVTLKEKQMIVDGSLTASKITVPAALGATWNPRIYDAVTLRSGTLDIAQGASLLLGAGASLNVKDGATLDVKGANSTGNDSYIILERNTSKLVLEPGARLDLTADSSIRGGTAVNDEAKVTVAVAETLNGRLLRLYESPNTPSSGITTVNAYDREHAPVVLTLGKFAVSYPTYTYTSGTVYEASVGSTSNSPAIGKLIAGSAGTLPNGSIPVLNTFITFAGTVAPTN